MFHRFGFGPGWGHFSMFGSGGGGLMILFWILIIVGIIYLVRNFSHNGSTRTQHHSRDEAEEIARERYARGEIDREELEQILRDLRR